MARTLSVRIKNEEDYEKFLKKLEQEKGTSDRQVGPKIEELIHNYVTQQENGTIDKAKYENLEHTLTQLQEKYDNLENKKEQLEKQNTITDSKDQQKEEFILKLQQENQKLQQEREIYKSDAQAAKARYETLDEQNTRLTTTIDQLNQELEKQRKDNTTIRNDYKHGQEIIEKLHRDNNEVEQENKKLNVVFAKITSMSLMQRILGKYPKEIKELNEGKY